MKFYIMIWLLKTDIILFEPNIVQVFGATRIKIKFRLYIFVHLPIKYVIEIQ